MAQFRGTVRGNRSMASRLGTKKSGLSVAGNAWNIGGRVELTHENGEDRVTLFITGGSNAHFGAQCIGQFRLASDGTFEGVK